MTQSVMKPWHPMAEPGLPRFLRVVREELAVSIGNELKSERARSILNLVLGTLDHLVVREERLDELLQPLNASALAALDRLSAVGQEAERAPVQASGVETSHGKTYLGVAAALEQAIERAVTGQTELTEGPFAKTWRAVLDVVRGEANFHASVEACEHQVSSAGHRSQDVASEAQRSRLQSYLSLRFGESGPVDVEDISAPVGGLSKDTLIVKLGGAGRPADVIVIRSDVSQGPLEGMVAGEFSVIKAMHEADIPVARPLWIENDVKVLGAPFIVTSCVPGKPLVDVKLEVVGEGTRECVRQLAQLLAAIHQVDPRQAGVSQADLLVPVQEHIRRELDRYERQWRRRRLGPSTVVCAGFTWMKSNIPKNISAVRIVHGDAQLRNMLFQGHRVTAMLDWETWHLGDPGEDVAYSRMDVERFMPWEEFVAEYHDAGGVPFSQESERFWGMWMYLRGAVTSISMMDRLLRDPPADIRPAFAGPHYTRFCIRKIAEYLTASLAT